MEELKVPDEVKIEAGTVQVPGVIPIMPLFNVAVYPRMMFPMEVSGEQAIQLVDEAMSADRIMGLLLAKTPPQEAKLERSHFFDIGTSAVILKMARSATTGPSSSCRHHPFRCSNSSRDPYIRARWKPSRPAGGTRVEALRTTSSASLPHRQASPSPQEFAPWR